MADNLPAAPLPDDVIDRVAREVALELRTYIEIMYPDVAAAKGWQSCRVSLHGLIRNHMASAAKAAEEGRIEPWLKRMRTARREWISAWRKAMTVTPAA